MVWGGSGLLWHSRGLCFQVGSGWPLAPFLPEQWCSGGVHRSPPSRRGSRDCHSPCSRRGGGVHRSPPSWHGGVEAWQWGPQLPSLLARWQGLPLPSFPVWRCSSGARRSPHSRYGHRGHWGSLLPFFLARWRGGGVHRSPHSQRGGRGCPGLPLHPLPVQRQGPPGFATPLTPSAVAGAAGARRSPPSWRGSWGCHSPHCWHSIRGCCFSCSWLGCVGHQPPSPRTAPAGLGLPAPALLVAQRSHGTAPPRGSHFWVGKFQTLSII